MMSQYYQRLYDTQTPPPDSLVTKQGKFLLNRFRRDNGDTSERVDTESVEAAIEDNENGEQNECRDEEGSQDNLHW